MRLKAPVALSPRLPPRWVGAPDLIRAVRPIRRRKLLGISFTGPGLGEGLGREPRPIREVPVRLRNVLPRLPSFVLLGASLALPPLAQAADQSLVKHLDDITSVASTVPADGDLNPYGVAVVPRSSGRLVRDNVLVCIVEVAPGGEVGLFARIDPTRLPGPCPGGAGLTTALSVLPSGWVIVGSLPTPTAPRPPPRPAACLS